MSTMDEALKETIKLVRKQVAKTPIAGNGMNKWRFWKGRESLIETGGGSRVFEVRMSEEPPEAVTVGTTSTDYNVYISIDICYEDNTKERVQACADFTKIRKHMEQVNKSAAQAKGLNFLRFESHSFTTGGDGNDKGQYIYMKIPVMCRITVS